MCRCAASKARHAVVSVGLLAVVACRPGVPASPDDLHRGSFAIRLHGVVIAPRRVAVDETVTGTACRIGEFIRLDNRSMTRRFLIRFLAITPTVARPSFFYPSMGNAD